MESQKRRPTRARVERVRRLVNDALVAVHELDSRRVGTISLSLCNAERALTRWANDLESSDPAHRAILDKERA